jgi:TIR domain
MPFLAGFTNDIFISYASVDNEPDAQSVRWVSRFRNDLETALRRRLGKDVSIYFDQADLHAYDEVATCVESARTSAIFLAVCSPTYIEHQWPLRELRAFHEAAKERGGQNRLVTIEVLSLDDIDLPPEIENLKRTRFYTRDSETGTDLPLTSASQPAAYSERLQLLAHQLVLLLRELQGRLAMQPAAASRPAPLPAPAAVILESGPAPLPNPAATTPAMANKLAAQGATSAEMKPPPATIVLAQSTDDVYDERQKVATYLEDYGVQVIPVAEYPASGAAFANAVNADLEHAEMFVQLLGRVRSFKPEDLRAEGEPPKSYAQYQFDAAKRRAIPVLQWRHPEINVDQVPAINWDRQLLGGPEVRAMGLQDFMKEVRSALEKLKQQPEPKLEKGDFIFINADRSDVDLAQTLMNEFQHRGCNAVLPMEDGAASAKDVETDLEANLMDCKGLLLVYGNASLGWVRAQARRLFKLESRRQEPLRVKSILFGPPPRKPDIGVAGFQLIDWQDGATAERLGKIVSELRM